MKYLKVITLFIILSLCSENYLLPYNGTHNNVPVVDINTNMMKAAKEGNIILLDEYIKKGQNVDTKDQLGWTPLLWATYYGHVRVADFLLKNNADINYKCRATEFFMKISSKSAAIHMASCFNWEDIAKLLINSGADINTADSDGRTPLILASYYGNTEIVKLLIDKGADPNIRDKRNNTAIMYARNYNFVEIYEILSGKKIGE